MGLEGGYIPLLLAAAGTTAQVVNDQHAARKRDSQLAVGISEQAEKRRQASQRTMQTVDQLGASNPDAARAQNYQQFMDVLRQNAASPVTRTAGATSSRYGADASAADASVGDYGSNLAGLLSKIDAAGQQRTAEKQNMTRAGTDVGLIQDAAKGDAFVNDMRVRAIKANPWVNGLAKFAQLAGGAMAGTAAMGGGAKALGGGAAGALNGGAGAVDYSTMARGAFGAV